MKYLLFIPLMLLSIVSCSKQETENTISEIQEIRYGTSFGECIGYCGNNLTITSSEIVFEKGGSYFDCLLPTINQQETVDATYLNELFEKVNFEDFLDLNEVIGCPDCSDGGAEWLEIITKSQTHKVTFDYFTNQIPELENILESIRQLNNSLDKAPFVIVDNDIYNDTKTNNYTIQEITIDGNLLKINIISSGCGGSNWITNLIDSGSIFESSPLQRNLRVNLINKEACLAIVSEVYEIDISKLQIEGENELLLNIEGWDKKITYSY